MSNLLIEDYILLSIINCILQYNSVICVSLIKFTSDTVSNKTENIIFRARSNLDLIV